METAANKPDQSEIRTFGNGGFSASGPDAMRLMQAITLRSSIRLHMKTGMIPTRGVTITYMFNLATEFTAKKYKRGQHQAAIDDLDVWINLMKSGIPTTHEGQEGTPS